MLSELKRFVQDESGPELVEWAVVTVILILATFAVLQAIGGQLNQIYLRIRDTLGQILQIQY
jgi:Flp pilus assembly pilin Flp